MHRRGYCRTAVPGTITKPTLSLPLLELNQASPARCAQDYKAPQSPAALATPGPTAALAPLARIRGTAVTRDKVPSCHHPSVPPKAALEHSEEPMGGMWGWGSLPTSQLQLFQSCSPSCHCCPSLSSWAQTWAIQGVPRKIWYAAFVLQFWTNLLPPGHRAAQGWH